MACQFEETCHLPPVTPGHPFCWLHDPQKSVKGQNNYNAYKSALVQFIESGNTNFQHMFLPDPHKELFNDATFATQVVFSDTSFPDGLLMNKATLEQGLKIEVEDIPGIYLEGTNIHGHTQIVVKRNLVGFKAGNAEFLGDLSINFINGSNLYLGAEFHGDVKIRGNIEGAFNLGGARIHKNLCLSTCKVRAQCYFENVSWEPSSSLSLTKATLYHEIMLDGPSCPPQIDLTESDFQKTVTIGPTVNRPLTIVNGCPKPPIFNNKDPDVIFRNVDMSKCRLLGNNIGEMAFVNVKWPKWHGRVCLFDEIFFRSFRFLRQSTATGSFYYFLKQWFRNWAKPSFPCGNLKEHYQSLKQMYLDRGDHARAGDFHYGEMEMKRRERGWPTRVLCPEFLYWLLSGYGVGYVRAFVWLILLILLATVFYWANNQVTFAKGFSSWLLFSLQVATLQRPPTPQGINLGFQWVQGIQGIVAPILIALFAFALRMRVKR